MPSKRLVSLSTSLIYFVLVYIAIGFGNAVKATPVSPTTTTLNVGIPYSSSIQPCTTQLFQVGIPTLTVSNYLVFQLTQNNNSDVLNLVVTAPSGVTQTCSTSGNTGCEIPVTCASFPPTNGAWLLSLTGGTLSALQYNLTVLLDTVPVTSVTLGTSYQGVDLSTTSNDGSVYDVDEYVFFSVSLGNIPLGASFTISVTGVTTGLVDYLYLSTAGFPISQCASKLPFSGRAVTYTYEACTLSSNTVVMIGVHASQTTTFNLTLSAALNLVTITPYTNETISDSLSADNDINYYSLFFNSTLSVNQYILVVVNNIVDGTLGFGYGFNFIPYSPSCGSSISECSSTSTRCQMVIPYCTTTTGNYIIGVQATSVDNNAVLTYDITITLNETLIPEGLLNGIAVPDAVGYTAYKQYTFSSQGTDPNGALKIWLYLDNSEQGATLLLGNNAPVATVCNSTFLPPCETDSNGFCFFTVDSCTFHQYSTWYISVYGSVLTTSGSPVSYTLKAAVETPTVLSSYNQVVTDVLQPSEYNHYEIDPKLWSEGQSIVVYVNSIINSLTFYSNINGLAGYSCPCYSYTDSQLISGGGLLTYTMTNCDASETFYISVNVANNSNPASYSLNLVPGVAPIAPSKTLTTSGASGTLSAALSNDNYTLSTGSIGNSSVIIVATILETSSSQTLAVTVSNFTTLCTPPNPNFKSCSASGSGRPFCYIVFDPCEYDPTANYFIAVSSGSQLSYNLQVITTTLSTTPLSSGILLADEVGQSQYKHYSFEVDDDISPSTELVVVVYINQGQSAPVQLYVNFNQLAGGAPCYNNIWSDSDAEKIVYVVPACNLEKGIYYFSVTSDSTPVLNPNDPLRYTVVATLQETSSFLPLGTTAQAQIYGRESRTYQFNITQSTMQTLAIYLAPVQGTFNAFLSAQSVESLCPCTYYITSKLGFSTDTTIGIDWCNLPSDTSYLLTIVAQGDSSTISSITASVQTTVYTAATLFASTPLSDSIGGIGYKAYVLGSAVPQNGQMVLSLTGISGGSLILRSTPTSGNLATQSCFAPVLLTCSSSNPCSVVLNQCSQVSGFSIVGAPSGGASSVAYTLNLQSIAPTTLIPNTANIFSLDGTLSNQYVLAVPNLPPNANAYAFNIQISDQTEGDLTVSYGPNICSLGNSQTLNPAKAFNVTASACQVTEGSSIVIQVASTEAQNFTIYANLTGLPAVQLTDGVVMSAEIAVAEVQVFAIPSFTVIAGVSQQLQVDVTTSSNNLQSYINVNSVGGPSCNYDSCKGNCPGSLAIPSCCVSNNDVVYVTVINQDNDVVAYNVSAYWVFESTFGPMLPTTALLQGTLSKTGVLYEFALDLSTVPSDLSSLVVFVDSPSDVSVYLERNTMAGDQACYTNNNQYSCSSTPCFNQFWSCDSWLQSGYIWVGLSTQAEGANYTIHTILQTPISLALNGTATGVVMEDQYVHYSIDVSEADLSAFMSFTVSIQVEGEGDIIGYLNLGSLAGSSSTCLNNIQQQASNGNGLATLDAALCGDVGTYYVGIYGTSDANFTISVETSVIYEGEPVQLALGTDTPSSNVSNPQTYVLTVNSTAVQGNQYLSVIFVPEDSGDIQQVSWLSDGFDCFSQATPCVENMVGNGYWVCLIDTCRLAAGTYGFFVNSKNDVVYQITPTLNTVTPFALGQGTIQDTLIAGTYNYYTYIINPGDLLLGQVVSITVQVASCGTSSSGSIQAFLTKGDPAGLDCADQSGASSSSPQVFTIDSCDPSLPTAVGTWYLSVQGTTQRYGGWGVPIQYSISVSTSTAAAPLTYITLNELYTINATTPTTWVLPLDGTFGLGSFTARLNGTYGSDLIATFQAPSTCTNEVVPQLCTVDSSGFCTITLDNCYQTGYLYIQTTSLNGNITVTSTNAYIQNITAGITPLPVNGWASSTPEYWRVPINSSLDNFLWTIEVSNFSSNVALTWSYDLPWNSNCPNNSSQTLSCTPSSSCTLTLSACQVGPTEDIFLTVLASGDFTTYTLNVSWNVDPMFPGNQTQCIEIPDNGVVYLQVPYLSTATQTQNLYFSVSSETSPQIVQVAPGLIASGQCYIADCGLTANNPCNISLSCIPDFTGNLSIVVSGTPGDYFSFGYEMTAVVSTSLTSGVATAGSSSSQLFSFTALQVTNFLLVEVDGASSANIYVKQNGVATSTCNDASNQVLQSPFVTLSCTYVPGAIYTILVTNAPSSSWSITATSINLTPTVLTTNTSQTGMFGNKVMTFSYSQPNQITSVWNSLTFALSANQESPVAIWIGPNTTPASDCALTSQIVNPNVNPTTEIPVPLCVLDAPGVGSYYVTLYSSVDSGTCIYPQPYAITPIFDSSEQGVEVQDSIPVLGGIYTSDTQDSFYFNTGAITNTTLVYITYSATSNGEVSGILNYNPTPPGSISCGTTISSGALQTLLFVDEPTTFFVSITPTSVIIPTNPISYFLTASLINPTLLSEGSVNFQTSQLRQPSRDYALEFYQIVVSVRESLVLQVTINNGPAVGLRLLPYSTTSDANADSTGIEYYCFSGTCFYPFGAVDDFPGFDSYLIVVYGSSTNYSIGYTAGNDNCAEPPSDQLTFCDINYATWQFGSYAAKDAYAEVLYYSLYDTLQNPEGQCAQNVITSDCATALKYYSCGSAFPVCDGNGFKTGLCEDICDIVSEKCGDYVFPSGMCDSNNFIDGDSQVCSGCSWYKCGDCNGTGEACGLAWWIILLIVLGGLLVLIAGYFGYQYYMKKRGGSYDSNRNGIFDDSSSSSYRGGYESIPPPPPADISESAPPPPPSPPSSRLLDEDQDHHHHHHHHHDEEDR